MKIERFEAAGLKCIEVVPEQATGDLPLIIGLHGRGDWGESYVDIGPMISETDYRYIFPTGPLPLEGALYEWFRLESHEIAREAAQARQLIFKLLNELSTKYNSPAPRTFLFGFSQGGMMTLEAGLRYRDSQGKPLAGLASLSGLLIADAPFNQNVMLSPATYYGADRGELKKILEEAAAAQIPVFIGHGSYDPVVPVMAGRAAHDVLTAAGLVVEYLEFPGDHQITLNEIEKLSQFVNQCFNGFKRQ